MRGHVHRRGGTWTYVVDIGPDPLTGKRRQRTKGGFPTQKAANQELRKTLSLVDTSQYLTPTKLLTGVYLYMWLKGIQHTLRRRTHEGHSSNIRLHVEPYIGSLPLARITPLTLNTLYSKLSDKGLGPRTIQIVHLCLSRALGDAVKVGLLPTNPARKATPPKPQPKVARTWGPEDLRAFMAHSEGSRRVYSRHSTAWLVLATTGLRRGEVLGLRARDVDFVTGTLHVQQQLLIGANSEMWFEPVKTAAGRRSVSLDLLTLQRLRQVRPLAQDQLLFTEPNGGPINPRNFTSRFNQAVSAAGVPRIRLHDLRHTWATLALKAGVPTKVVQERLGHSSIVVTSDTYQHVLQGMDRDAAETVAANIFANTGT